MLYSTGLVAGGSIGGVLIAFLAFFGDRVLHMEDPTLLAKLDLGSKLFPALRDGPISGNVLCGIVFAILCFLLGEERAEEAGNVSGSVSSEEAAA